MSQDHGYKIVCRNCHTSHEWTPELHDCPKCGYHFVEWDIASQMTMQRLAREGVAPEKQGCEKEIMH